MDFFIGPQLLSCDRIHCPLAGDKLTTSAGSAAHNKERASCLLSSPIQTKNTSNKHQNDWKNLVSQLPEGADTVWVA